MEFPRLARRMRSNPRVILLHIGFTLMFSSWSLLAEPDPRYPEQWRIGDWADDERVADYVRKHRKLPPLLLEPLGRHVTSGSPFWRWEGEPPARTYIFYCTLYYTPRESGFSRQRGFDVTPVTKPGLGGRSYPADFLRAVRKEGFGRISEPFKGRSYIKFDGHSWGYARAPLGNRGNALIARKSAAVRTPHPVLSRTGKLRTHSGEITDVFGNADWQIDDTGGGIRRWQIDLYWGEDDPRGPGQDLARPRGTAFQYAFDVPVQIK
jgi:hypothetical protein